MEQNQNVHKSIAAMTHELPLGRYGQLWIKEELPDHEIDDSNAKNHTSLHQQDELKHPGSCTDSLNFSFAMPHMLLAVPNPEGTKELLEKMASRSTKKYSSLDPEITNQMLKKQSLRRTDRYSSMSDEAKKEVLRKQAIRSAERYRSLDPETKMEMLRKQCQRRAERYKQLDENSKREILRKQAVRSSAKYKSLDPVAKREMLKKQSQRRTEKLAALDEISRKEFLRKQAEQAAARRAQLGEQEKKVLRGKEASRKVEKRSSEAKPVARCSYKGADSQLDRTVPANEECVKWQRTLSSFPHTAKGENVTTTAQCPTDEGDSLDKRWELGEPQVVAANPVQVSTAKPTV